jgi:flavin-binding protein dodecin
MLELVTVRGFTGQGNDMIGRSIAAALMLMMAGGTAEAGTLRSGTWTPAGCGPEPTPPTINGSSRAAYEASAKDAQAYQQAAKQYDDCFFNEANTDNHVIGSAVKDHQTQVQAAFDKLQADSKAAVDRLNKKQ